MTSTSSASTTTESVRGVWQRLFEEDPIGDDENADKTTLVWWTQAPQSGLYVDLRLPLGSLGRSDNRNNDQNGNSFLNPCALKARGLQLGDSLSEDDRVILLQQKSFAGILHFSLGDTTDSKAAMTHDHVLADLASKATDGVDGSLPLSTCYWEREIDYRPPTGGLDIGVCASGPPNLDGSIDMRETGDDASYAEGWHRLVGSECGPFLACRLITENDIERKGFWVRTGKYFAYAIGRPNNAEDAQKLKCPIESPLVQTCVGKTLKEAVNEGGWGLDVVGSYVSVCGEVVTTDDGTTSWKILHSTNPALVGCELLGTGIHSCSTLTLDGGDDTVLSEGCLLNQNVGSDDDDCIRTWKVFEVSDVATMMEELSLTSTLK